MSSARGRSWRPERKVNAKDTRRRTIFVLVGLLVALIGFLVITPFLREPAVRFVSLVPDDYQIDRTGLPVLPPSATNVNDAALRKVFDKHHEYNERRVLKPEQATSLDELLAIAKSDKRLILYCTWGTVVEYDGESKQAVVKFRPGDKSTDIVVTDFLAALNELSAKQITLLLDSPSKAAGLANGKLSDDAMPLLKAAVDEAKLSKLVVISACDAGQRSWEYVADKVSAASSTDAGENAAQRYPAVGRFSGTAFGHFVRQAAMQRNTGTPQDLFTFVKSNVESWVRDQYGEEQTVVMMPSTSSAWAAR